MTMYAAKRRSTAVAVVVFPGGMQTALQEAQRTLGLVRQHAAERHVDPRKIGVIGFSAGGHLAAAVSTHFAQRTSGRSGAYPRGRGCPSAG
jgi:acetyl esterase/lipase